MRRFLARWVCVALGVWAAWIVLITLPVLDRSVGRMTEVVLGPWLALCRSITPEAWQTQGNIPLGLVWLLAGMLVVSMVLAAAGLGMVTFLRGSVGASRAR